MPEHKIVLINQKVAEHYYRRKLNYEKVIDCGTITSVKLKNFANKRFKKIIIILKEK